MVFSATLRLIGIHHGLPYVYNADENAHFVPRAVGMFGHSLDPGYFINPPALTYLFHVAFALRWGTREAVGNALATDPTAVFTLARTLVGLLGAASVGFTAWAGAKLFGRAAGLTAGGLLAVAFLPVHYGHLALNDVPALAPLALVLLGAAGALRQGGLGWYALAGVALGVACATKYTAGIVLLALLAAAALGPGAPRRRLAGLLLAGALALAAFLVANPYALLDHGAFTADLAKQSGTANDGGGKLGLTQTDGVAYYLGTLTWGLGWLPTLAAAGGAAWLAVRDRRLALVLVPAPLLLGLFLGAQDRVFARWLLPVYPILCLLAAAAVVAAGRALAARAHRLRPGWAIAGLAALVGAQGLVLSVHNDVVLAREDTRGLARAWLVAHVPEGAKIVVEPIAPDAWAMDVGPPSTATRTGSRWTKFPTSRSRVANDGTVLPRSRRVKLEDYERTLRPTLVSSYARGGYCWVVTGSTQYGRALAEPREVPEAIGYYAELRRRGRIVARFSPWERGKRVPFSFDASFTGAPLAYERPGPEIVVYRLTGGACQAAPVGAGPRG
jgi:hypothetical protein